MYLGASLEKVETKGKTKCWSMSAKKYFKATVVKLEATLSKRYMQLPTSHYLIPTNYHPSEDVSNYLKTRGVQAYQELIGELLWAVEIGRVECFFGSSTNLFAPCLATIRQFTSIISDIRILQARTKTEIILRSSVSVDQKISIPQI